MAFSGFFVCAECKPLAVEKLGRGEAIGGYWRDKSKLVFAVGRSLPDRCVRCNVSSEGYRVKRNIYWHSPLLYLLLLFSPIIYILAAMIVRKRAKVEIPLCPEHRRRRTKRLMASVGVSVAAVVAIFGTIAYVKASDLATWIGVTSGLVLLGAIIAAAVFSRVVEPKKMTNTHIFLKGAGEPFLAELPVWPNT